MKSGNCCYVRSIVTLLALLLIWGYTGCTSQDVSYASDTATVTERISPTPSQTTRPTATATVVPAPTSTSSSTAIPTPTATPLPTGTATWTPIPTLVPDVALEALLQLYSDNGGCELPCWWGITPGETAWAEARTKLAPLGQLYGPWGEEKTIRYDFIFDVPEEIHPWKRFEPSLGVKDGIVVGINLNSRWVEPDFDYSLAGLLQAYGPPDEIWLEVVTDTPYEPYYDMHLFYSAKGILLAASGIIQTQGTFLTICPQEFKLDSFPPALMVWNPAAALRYQAVFYSVMGSRAIDPPDFHLLEEFSEDFDNEDFYETYLDSQTTTCFGVNSANLP